MNTGGRVLLLLGLLAGFAGCGLTAWGWAQQRVSGKASTQPVVVDLAKLEARDKKGDLDNHLQIGPHYAFYYSCVFATKQKKQGRGRWVDTDKVDFLFYPIVSLDNPEVRELERLEKEFGGLDKVPDVVDLPQPKNFAVLVKTRRFKKVDDIPREDFRKEELIRGLVVNEITSLTREEKALLKEDFPDIDFKNVIILEDGRSPVSSGVSVSAMVGGGCCFAADRRRAGWPDHDRLELDERRQERA
jgi:hypothetical protein